MLSNLSANLFRLKINKCMPSIPLEGFYFFYQENCFRLFQLQKHISTLGTYYF